MADASFGRFWAAATISSFGTAVTAAGGGVLVVVGTVAAAILVPSFVRYRVTRSVSPVR
ncbi:MAG TPA: hypothetical protein VFI00_18160 [Kribbella sp.]|nr:hypothetical protein [Kribbella sp.]